MADVIRPASRSRGLYSTRRCRPRRARPGLAGGLEAREAIEIFLDHYGMRGTGEIDITRPRWRERPATLLPVILAHIKNFKTSTPPSASSKDDKRLRRKSWNCWSECGPCPTENRKPRKPSGRSDRVRIFIGYREYPKYGMVSRYLVYKQALLAEANRLVRADALRETDDIFYLRFEELQDVVRTNQRMNS